MGKIIEGKKIPTFKADATNDSVFDLKNNKTVSYTHLTLPTSFEV